MGCFKKKKERKYLHTRYFIYHTWLYCFTSRLWYSRRSTAVLFYKNTEQTATAAVVPVRSPWVGVHTAVCVCTSWGTIIITTQLSKGRSLLAFSFLFIQESSYVLMAFVFLSVFRSFATCNSCSLWLRKEPLLLWWSRRKNPAKIISAARGCFWRRLIVCFDE